VDGTLELRKCAAVVDCVGDEIYHHLNFLIKHAFLLNELCLFHNIQDVFNGRELCLGKDWI